MESGGPPAEGDSNRSTSIRVYTTILITFTICMVALRFVVRKRITKIVGWDDWTILLAIVKTSLFVHKARNFIVLIYASS